MSDVSPGGVRSAASAIRTAWPWYSKAGQISWLIANDLTEDAGSITGSDHRCRRRIAVELRVMTDPESIRLEAPAG